MSTIVSSPRRTIAPALWAASVVVLSPRARRSIGLTLAAALDLDAAPGASVRALDGTVLAICLADRPGVWQTTDAATVPA